MGKRSKTSIYLNFKSKHTINFENTQEDFYIYIYIYIYIYKIYINYISYWEDNLLPLSCLDGQSDEKSAPLRDMDRFGNDL